MSDNTTKIPYTGSCHCGQAKFSFALESPIQEQEVVQCNCSICETNGYLLVYANAADMTYHHSDDAVKPYYFASKQVPHYFCVNCGTSLYAKGDIPQMGRISAINVRTVPGINIDSLKIKKVDGRSR